MVSMALEIVSGYLAEALRIEKFKRCSSLRDLHSLTFTSLHVDPVVL